MSLALKGIKVVDVSQFVAGPAAAQHLGDFGAEVIHVEAPLTGDPWRGFLNGAAAAGGTWAPPSEINYPFEIFNRNKRSLSLDLSQEDGQAVLHRLLEEADVFLTSLRPSQQERFQVDYAALHERYPKLIHGSVTGAGKNGPERDLPAFDATAYWFRSGVHHAFSEPGTGGMTGWRPVFGDSATGMSLFAGIMTALYTRERTGVGQQVDLSLFSMGVYQLSFDVAGCLATGTDFREMAVKKVEGEGDTDRMQQRAKLVSEAEAAAARLREFVGEVPMVLTYQTKDGRSFSATRQAVQDFPRICRLIGREDLIDDPRFATPKSMRENAAEFERIIRDGFLTKTLDDWRPILNREEIPWAPGQTFREVVNDPQARANDFFVPFDHPTHGRMEVIANPIKLSETPATIRLPAPEFSQHTEEILLETGYSWEDIARFKDKGVIA